ncbi:hypothetical protein EPUL_005964, partial [Erysiphe pulchra]
MSLRLGDTAPDFTQESSEGTLNFYEFLGDSWGILFSHPADYTPVCTTELGYTAKLKQEFEKRGVKAIALSVDDVESHKGWINDINETQNTSVNFPIIADQDLATPANWQEGEDVVIVPSLQDEAELKQRFPKGYTA